MIDRPVSSRVSLAHDWLVGMRGGERVLDRLAQRFGPTTIYTLVDDGRPLSEAISSCRVVTSPLQRLPGAAGRLRRWYLPLMPWAVGRLKVDPCDLLISTSSAVMKSIRPPDGTPHLCYCHSPARYVWEQSDDYSIGGAGRIRRAGLRVVRRPFQAWDRRTASSVTRFLANSRHVASRIQRCFGREAAVVYPPVRTTFFTPDQSIEREPWWLVVAALEPYKRVDLAVDAANRGGFPLRVAGAGSQRAHLESRAGSNVEFLGRVDDLALLDLYRRAKGLIVPQQEDFGIIPVEAQAAGCPVLAYGAGGALETVTAQTGVFFKAQTVDALLKAMNHFEARSFDLTSCRDNALRFAEDRFDTAILQHADELLSRQRNN